MNAVEVFDFQEQAVRAVQGPDGEWWFVARDICAALDLAKPENAYARLDADEKDTLIVGTLGGKQQMTIISEPGCYRLVFTSRTEKAEAFKRWLAHEVLPALRRTGRYEMPADAPLATSAPMLVFGQEIEVIRVALNVVGRAQALFGREAAQRLWAASPLPSTGLAGTPSVAAFAEDAVYDAPGCVVPARVMYTAYAAWCAARDERPLSEKAFAQAMAAAGFAKDIGRVRTYLDVALRAAPEN
jgi:prophage antirepressor-like protein